MSGVTISVEKLLEQQVEEITNTGEEKYIKPRSYSDELKYLSSKINFYEGSSVAENKSNDEKEREKQANENKQESGPDKNKSKEEKQWPWDSVHSKLRLALSEISVMLDVLQCLSRKKYLVLDQIQQNAEPNRQTVQMLEKRKYLARAGDIISKGANSLVREKSATTGGTMFSEMKDQYYMDLIHLRQYWSVKKIGSQITGTLSYRNTGSTFWHPGLFEIKPDYNEDTDNDMKRLSVSISPDLLKLSVIKVEIVGPDGNVKLISSSSFSKVLSENWNLKLKEAQANLFNKELFSNLCNDAFKSNLTDLEILNNRICCKILNNVTLTIELMYFDNKKDVLIENNHHSIELVLENLLLKSFIENSRWIKPSVTTLNLQENCLPSSSFHNLMQKNPPKKVSILNDFLDHCSTLFLTEKVKAYFEQKCVQLFDPILLIHWDSVVISGKPSVNVSFETNFGFKKRSKSLKLIISSDTFSIVFHDSTTYKFKPSIDDLDDVVKWYICSHFIDVASMMASQSKWSLQERSTTTFLPLDAKVPYEVSFYNKIDHQFLSLKISDTNNIEVKISQNVLPNEDLDPDFQKLCLKYQIMSWESIRGDLFVDKCQALFL